MVFTEKEEREFLDRYKESTVFYYKPWKLLAVNSGFNRYITEGCRFRYSIEAGDKIAYKIRKDGTIQILANLYKKNSL